MYRVIIQTGQGFKAHDRNFQSMRSAWGLRPAPSFVHGWGMRVATCPSATTCPWGVHRRSTRGRWIQHTLLTKRTHPWRIRTQRWCYSRLLREANRVWADPSRC